MAGLSLAIATVDSNGDIGGIGINRFYMAFPSGTTPADADLGTWSHVVMELYAAVDAYLPDSATFTFQPVVQVVDSESGALITELTPTSPAGPVSGLGSSGYAGGSGARLYWHTATVSGRRFIRGATYITPLANAAYDGGGGIAAAVVTGFADAGNSYVLALAGTVGRPVIWHRPAKTTHVGGLTGEIIGCTVTHQPGSLRSRRS